MRTGVIASTGLLILASTGIAAATLRVPQQFATIQAAVDAAAPGDTVLVGPGRYVENVLVQKTLTLKSSHGPRLTTVDGGGIGTPVAFLGTNTEEVALSGLTLTGGAMLEFPVVEYPNTRGAGIFVDSVSKVTLYDNIITGNRGCAGDGIVSSNASVVVRDNTVRDNRTMDHCIGSGLTVLLVGNDQFVLTASVERNLVTDNRGLGVLVDMFGRTVIRENRVVNNGDPDSLNSGGGIAAGYGHGVIANNLIARNVAVAGAALVVAGFPEPPASYLVTGNLILDNVSTLGISGESDVSLFGMLPSTIRFHGNVVVGDNPGFLIYCTGDGVHTDGNLVINRNPSGQSSFCTQ